MSLRLLKMSILFQVAVLCFSVGTVLSADSHCCLSKKFFGKGLIVTATLTKGSASPTMIQNSFEFEHDYDKKLERVNGSTLIETSNGQFITSYDTIRDFNHRKVYTFNDTVCSIDPLNEEMNDGCVPTNFTLYGTFAFGSGSESANVNGWVGAIGNEAWTMTTTVNDCTVVSYTRLGTQPDGTKITETAQFVDIVQNGLSYDTAFVVPAHCKSGTPAVGK